MRAAATPIATAPGATPPGVTAPGVLAAAYARFRRRNPEWESTRVVDELRAADYARLDAQGHVYLDYGGGGLYGESQLDAHHALLRDRVLGNPHSESPTSLASTALAEEARAAVRRFFGASADEYAVILTPNASGAIKLVAESFPFERGGRLLLTSDNHNSVNGVREFARAAGATTAAVRTEAELRVDEGVLARRLGEADPARRNLFAYPAQSNFSGVQHPLRWVAQAQAAGWRVLLDCAAFAPTNRLDLAEVRPDFVPISFYKLLGYPTGVGCLLARRGALAELRRPWFAGGTVAVVSSHGGWHVLLDGEGAWEDGTIDYLSLPAVAQGLERLARIGVDVVHTRVACLTGWLLDELTALRHADGRPAVDIHGPRTTESRGGTIALTFRRRDGRAIHVEEVERRAAARGISLRTGCFCNPGATEDAFGLEEGLPRAGNRIDALALAGVESGGAVRVSLGLATTFGDACRFLEFARALAGC